MSMFEEYGAFKLQNQTPTKMYSVLNHVLENFFLGILKWQ